MFVYEGAAEHFAAQAIEEDAVGVELPVKVVAIPDGNAGLVFEFENEVAPAVQDLNVIAFERRIRKRYDIIDAVAVGRKHVGHPNVGVGDVNSDERGVDTAQVVCNG